MTHPDGPSDELDAQVREHYAAQSLSPEKLSHLKAVARGEVVPEAATATPSAWRAWLAPALKALVAAALLVGALGPYLGWWGPGKLTSRELAHQIANELAINHTKQLPLDVNTNTWAVLAAGTRSQLDFTPIEPDELEQYAQLHLVGARFSSVGGQMVLQARLADTRGSVYTLYQLRPGQTYASLNKTKYEFDVHGVRILIWRERGLILGLARLSPTLH